MMSNRKRTVLGVLLAAAAAIICGAIDELLKESAHEDYPQVEGQSPLNFEEEE